jgi:hypothetical protein
MHRKQRERLLKIGAGAIVGLFLLDQLVFSWAVQAWSDQSERVAGLRKKVTDAQQLLTRSKQLRARWAEMQRTDLADNNDVAEYDVYKAVQRWAGTSRISFTNMQQNWRVHDEGYDTLEVRATANGEQSTLGRLLYELETDPLPARVHELELSARDAQGKQLAMSLRFSFVRLGKPTKGAR